MNDFARFQRKEKLLVFFDINEFVFQRCELPIKKKLHYLKILYCSITIRIGFNFQLGETVFNLKYYNIYSS